MDPFPPFAWLDTGKQFKAATKIVPDRRLLFTKKGDFNAWSARLERLERIQELRVNEISMLYFCAVSYIVGFSWAMKIYPAGFLKTLPLPSSHSQRVANMKTKNASIAVSLLFPSSSSLFPLLMWLLSLSGAKNLPVWAFFTQTTANFVRFVFKKSTGNTICKRCHTQTVLAKLRPINNSWRDADLRAMFLCKRSFNYCAGKLGLIDMIFFSLQGINTSLETLLLLNIVIFFKRSVTFHWQDNL